MVCVLATWRLLCWGVSMRSYRGDRRTAGRQACPLTEPCVFADGLIPQGFAFGGDCVHRS